MSFWINITPSNNFLPTMIISIFYVHEGKIEKVYQRVNCFLRGNEGCRVTDQNSLHKDILSLSTQNKRDWFFFLHIFQLKRRNFNVLTSQFCYDPRNKLGIVILPAGRIRKSWPAYFMSTLIWCARNTDLFWYQQVIYYTPNIRHKQK